MDKKGKGKRGRPKRSTQQKLQSKLSPSKHKNSNEYHSDYFSQLRVPDTISSTPQSSVDSVDGKILPKKENCNSSGNESSKERNTAFNEETSTTRNDRIRDNLSLSESGNSLQELHASSSSQCLLSGCVEPTQFVTQDTMNDSLLMDFKTPVFHKRKVQSKLLLGKERIGLKTKRNDASVNKIKLKLLNENKTRTECELAGSSTGEKCELPLEVKNETSPPVEENQQQNTSLCPLCWKRFDKNQMNVSHMKTCAAKHNMTIRQLLDAMELQEKQTAEREALGLPGVPNNQTAKKSTTRKGSSASNSNDPNLQLALALSASMREAEEQQMMQEEVVLIEAGLGQEVFTKQMSLLERFGFTSSRPAVLSSGNPRQRLGKLKLKGFPTLLTRTDEERERLITEKVAIILMGEEDGKVEDLPVKTDRVDRKLTSEILQKYQSEECVLWNKASTSPSQLVKSSYYVEHLSRFISPSKVEAGAKLKHLSQVPCRLKTPVKEFHELQDKEDEITQGTHSKQQSETPPSELSNASFKEENTPDRKSVLTNQACFLDVKTPVRNCCPVNNECFSGCFFERKTPRISMVMDNTGFCEQRTPDRISAMIGFFEHRTPKTNLPDGTNMAVGFFEQTTPERGNKSMNLSEFTTPSGNNEIIDQPQISKRNLLQQNLVKKSTINTSFADEFMSNWRSILNKSAMSDITIYVKNRLKIPTHELILYVRCPLVLRDVVKEENKASGEVSKSINWSHVPYRSALAFLEYVYCGGTNKILSLSEGLEDVQRLAQTYQLTTLEQHLKGIANIRIKVTKVSPEFLSQVIKLKNVLQSKQGCVQRDEPVLLQDEAQVSQSLLTPKYKSPKNRHNRSANLELADRSLKESDKSQTDQCSSPDPFSETLDAEESNNTEVKDEGISQNPEKNLESLLNLIEISSPILNSPVENEWSDKVKVNVILDKFQKQSDLLCTDKYQTMNEESPTENTNMNQMDCSPADHIVSTVHSDTSSRSSNKSAENKRKLSDCDSFNNCDVSASKKQCKDENISVRRTLSKLFVSESECNITVQQQEDKILTFDLTQSSTENEQPSPEKKEKAEDEYICTIISSGSSISSKISNIDKLNVNEMKSDHLSVIDEVVESVVTSNIDNDNIEVISPTESVHSDPDAARSVVVEQRSCNVSVDNEFDYFDYHYSPCKIYSPERSLTPHNKSPNLESSPINKSTPFKMSSNQSLSQNDTKSPKSSHTHKKYFSQSDVDKKSEKENKGRDTSDIIVLDDSSDCETQCTEKNNAPSSSKVVSSPIRNSLDSVKRFLEDSFMDELGNVSAWKDEIEPMSGSCSTAATCSTPKQITPPKPTGMESCDVTPLADYSAMSTPLLKKELHKYGLKPLKKKQAKMILRHIYNELHPFVEDTSPDFKRPDKDTQVPKSPVKRRLTKQINSSPKKVSMKPASHPSPHESENSDSEAESNMSSSQNSSVSSARSDFITANDIGLDEQGLAQQDPSASSDLPTVVRNFITSNSMLHQKVLMYEPIWLEQLHSDLKGMKYKFKLDQLMHYLDEQCITFRTAQQQKSRTRKKKSPKKKNADIPLSQKKVGKGKKTKQKATSSSSKNSEDLSNS